MLSEESNYRASEEFNNNILRSVDKTREGKVSANMISDEKRRKEDEKWFIVRVMQRQTRKLLWWAHPDKSELFAALLLLSRRCCDCLLEWKPHEHDACLCNQRAICASRTPESNVITDELFFLRDLFSFRQGTGRKKESEIVPIYFLSTLRSKLNTTRFFSLFGIVEIVL